MITIDLIELFKVIGLFIIQGLDSYCRERYDQFFYQRLFAKNQEEFYELLIEPVPEQSNVFSIEEVAEVNYTKSDIEGTPVEDLFNNLQVELAGESKRINYDDRPSYPDEEDCLTLNDLNNEWHVTIDDEYVSSANAKIKDELIGIQKWTVNVIGEEKQYIHVSDGDRIWLDVGNYASKITVGDIISVELDRQLEKIEIREVSILHHFSEDYMIYDETDAYMNVSHHERLAM
ncbi:hypothetical protein D5E69_22960 (plasmid) [Rossellomorea marisflavi]|uniref:hypothetical protein n=1 Tax=Rossellomorea marisflavi TaxID=189381 RepID=UPI0013180643|nr:hypothetical protein [Rossellomorea marisflavi]QHA38698.1 hypothetical protein D5E69_22960 [Rossellomorea marisflavi]